MEILSMPIPDAVFLLAKLTVLWIWVIMMIGVTLKVIIGSIVSALYLDSNYTED